jgi:toxin CptA
LSPASAPPLRLALKTDRILPALAVLALCAIVGAVTVVVMRSDPVLPGAIVPFLAAAAAAWTWSRRAPHWDWLGCDPEGRWWIATREGLRHEQRFEIRVLPDTRVSLRWVVLVCRFEASGAVQVLWLPWWRMDPGGFRRLRVRLRWSPEPEPKSGWGARLRAGLDLGIATLTRSIHVGALRMHSPPNLPAVDHLLSDDPDHVYTEDELDAIEEVDPELALRLDRAQTFAQRQAADVPAEGPIDEDAVRLAVEEARRILMQDGGDIEYVGLDGRTVQVRLKGACVGCPRSTLDLRNVVERLVRSRAPGVERVANTF